MMKIISIITVGVLMSSCCDICEQPVPPLRPMPPCGVYYVEDIIEIPVTPSSK